MSILDSKFSGGFDRLGSFKSLADAYWERDYKPWDAAAGLIIVKESGGFVTSIDNEDNPIYSGNLVAGNQNIYTEVRKIVRNANKETTK